MSFLEFEISERDLYELPKGSIVSQLFDITGLGLIVDLGQAMFLQ
jgi:hypothetical protein